MEKSQIFTLISGICSFLIGYYVNRETGSPIQPNFTIMGWVEINFMDAMMWTVGGFGIGIIVSGLIFKNPEE
jgi:hypothetical protein